MDPQSVAFVPQSDSWRLHNELLRLQQVQSDHSDRLLRLERRQEDDARMKSVWGGASPFPSVLSGTPQQAPLQNPLQDQFKNFDDDSSNLIGSLHLDAEEEPRRIGATSRANSVRFDESANQGHWAHASRSSVDFIPRSSSGLGGFPMTERSSSHKSDGRASSVHSVRSAASGRASSLNLDTGYGLGEANRSPLHTPAIAPGLLVLGTVPAIIRCWMNTNFKHDALLYAAVCTASFKSFLGLPLIQKLGFEDRIVGDVLGGRTVELPVYFPEAVPHPASSRSSSPAPQLPTLTVVFTVIERDPQQSESKAIQIFIGSDTLRAHNADILFSSNSMTLYDDDRSKLSIPLVRPENEAVFNCLVTTGGSETMPASSERPEDTPSKQQSHINGLGQSLSAGDPIPSSAPSPPAGKYRPPGVVAAENESSGAGTSDTEQTTSRPESRQANSLRPPPGLVNTRVEVRENSAEASPSQATPSRAGSSPAIWSSWRRDSSAQNNQVDLASAKNKDGSYQRKDTGIKVLKPARSTTRTLSSTLSASPSPADGRSRFFDDGKRRATDDIHGEQKGAPIPSVDSKSQTPAATQSGQLAFRTASSKKRKIAPLPQEDSLNGNGPPLFAPEVYDPDRQPSPPSSSPRRPPLSESQSTTPLSGPRSSPVHFLPPHLQLETSEGLRGGAYKADSPSGNSEAYAALNLGSSVYGSSMSGGQDGDAVGHNPAEVSNKDGFGRTEGSAEARRLEPRSVSPAKRSADTMDGAEGTKQEEANGNTTVPNAQDTVMPRASASNKSQIDDAPPPYSAHDADRLAPPSYDEQYERVFQLMQAPVEEGEKGFVVSMRWLGRVIARATEGRNGGDHGKEALEGDVGPVDNSDIVPQGAFASTLSYEGTDIPFVPLNPGLTFEQEYLTVPEKAWNLIMEWYGVAENQKPIIRFVVDTAPGAVVQNLMYESYPPVFTIRKVLHKSTQGTKPPTPPGTSASTSQTATGPPTPERDTSEPTAVKILATSHESSMKWLARAKKAAGIEIGRKVKIWRQMDPSSIAVDNSSQQAGMLTPDASRSGSPESAPNEDEPKLVIEPSEFAKWVVGTDYEMVDLQDHTTNEKYNGKSTLEILGLGVSQTIVLEELAPGSDNQRNAKKGNAGKTKFDEANGRASPAPSGPVTRGRTRKDGRTRGAIGLTNLGNTCYMNSALQCISRVEELAIFFLQGKYKTEINTDNPIGYNGKMAKAYAGVIEGLYNEASASAFRPGSFKGTLGMNQPQFSGYGQQDSQEFLSFLVDALHEDLNRIHKKPYLENPDSDDATVHDPEAIKALGQKYRENYRARNDSIAVDLFNGFYKNTLECPVCDKVSVTFDPYSLLTLQLPIENTWQHKIIFVPLNSPPTQYEVDMDKNAPVKAIKEFIASRVPGLENNRMLFMEEFSQKIYKVFPDKESIAEQSFQPADHLYMYELPEVPTNVNYEMKKKGYRSILYRNEDPLPDMDSPQAERMVVPVLHRRASNGAGLYNSSKFDLIPSWIVISREEAKDADAIFRKVLLAVSRVTSFKFLEVDWDKAMTPLPRAQRSSEAETAVGDDAATDNAEAKVSDRSVDSDDGYVDISVNKSGQEPAQTVKTHVPDISQPGTLISPVFRNMFEMKYTKGDDMHCTGNLSQIKPMLDRVQLPARRGSVASVRSNISQRSQDSGYSGRSRSGSSDEDADTPDVILGEESATPSGDLQSDDELPSVENLISRKSNARQKFNRNRNRKQMTYSPKVRRGSKQSVRSNLSRGSTKATPESETDSDPYYIKLGEGIVLDWRDDAFDTMFGGDADKPSDDQGYFLLSNLDTAEDQELQAKKQKRAQRKKNGVTLEECFAETGKTEILSEDNAWRCPRCKEERRASKTLEIWTAPDILVVHLKRFSGERHRRDKVDVLVDFPLEGLDLSNKVGFQEEGKECIYDLFAVDNHYGGLGGGHYTAMAKNFFDGKWYDFNGKHSLKPISHSFVSSINNPATVVTNAAYLLFYRRRSLQPLGPPYLRELVNNARKGPDEDSNDSTSSDAEEESESGEGQRSGFSRPLGSSNAGTGAGAGAGNPSLRGGAGPAGDAVSRLAKQSLTSDDEGISLDDGDNDNTFKGHRLFDAGQDQGWSFENINVPDDASTLNGAPSSVAAAEGPDDLAGRLMEDFDDDDRFSLGAGGQNTPLTGDEDPELSLFHQADDATLDDYADAQDHGPQGVDMIRLGGEAEVQDPPVRDIIFDDSKDDME